MRRGDSGLHAVGCPGRPWAALKGSKTVLVNGRPAFRMGDATQHRGGQGRLVQGSANVLIGDAGTPSSKPFSIDILLGLGATFVFRPPRGITSLVGTLMAELIPWLLARGIPGAIYRLWGKSMGPIADLITQTLSVALWIAWHTVKYKDKLAVDWAAWFFTNHIDNILDGGPRYDWDSCPAESVVPSDPPTYPDPSDFEGLFDVDAPKEKMERILRYFQPVEYQYSDDLYPLSVGSILRHSTLIRAGEAVEVPDGYDEVGTLKNWLIALQSGVDHVDIDDEFARGHIFLKSYTPTVYGSARQDGAHVRLEYKHMRAGSYLPTKQLIEQAFCHEGDGETAVIVVDPISRSIIGTETGGHGYLVQCQTVIYVTPSTESMNPSNSGQSPPPSRACIFVAHGSHAIASTPGKREAMRGHGAGNEPTSGGGVTDWHPPLQTGDGVEALLPQLVIQRSEEYQIYDEVMALLPGRHIGKPSNCK